LTDDHFLAEGQVPSMLA